MTKTIDISDPKKALSESTADCIDEMLVLDAKAQVAWRQVAIAIRAGDTRRALELLNEVGQICADARSHAEMAAKGVFVLACAHQLERTMPDKATGADLESLINMTTPPHAKNGDGGN